MQRDLVLKAVKGDSESFYQIVKKEEDSIYRLAYSFVKNDVDALDIVQDAVYKAFISISKLKNPEFFGTWLYRITINCAKNFVKNSKKVVYLEDSKLENFLIHTENCDEVMDLQEAFEMLDQKYKTVIILRFFEELTLKEIAMVLEIPLSTVKTRLYRGLKQLKTTLGGI